MIGFKKCSKCVIVFSISSGYEIQFKFFFTEFFFCSGYEIQYTSSPSLGHWTVQHVPGNRLTAPLSPLSPATTYYYKLQARNSRGHSPVTQVMTFTTLPQVEGQ